MNEELETIRFQIAAHDMNKSFRDIGYVPVFVADERARIAVIGHAPGLMAQTRRLAWGDLSGERLKYWMGVSEETFRDPSKIALIPMDFYYQGKGKTGDLPPRKGFAAYWHPKLLAQMPHVELYILTGHFAVSHYVDMKQNLTETVRNFDLYLPTYFPIVHPSPINNRWLAKNRWFTDHVVPALQARVSEIIGDSLPH